MLLSIVLENVLTQSFKGHAAQITGGDDAVGVDVIQQQGDPGSANRFDLLHSLWICLRRVG